MNTSRFLLLIAAMTMTLTTLPAQARIVCWTNGEGVKECGDKIPPEFSQEGHQQLNEQGLVVDETARAKTDEELAEEKRLAEEQAVKDREMAEAAKHDKILLDTFSNVDDIQMASDGKVSLIESSITLTQKRNEKLQADLNKLVEQAATEERSGKAPSEDLVKDIDSLRKQIETNETFIADKRNEQETVKASYARDIARYKELKGIQ